VLWDESSARASRSNRCVPEVRHHMCCGAPGDVLPAARVRARLRYEKLVRAAAEGISSKNRDTLKGMVADER
jgi:hypothetical protein